MKEWTFEPGHSGAEFCVRHMMVVWIRGHFKNIKGKMKFDPNHPTKSSVEITIDANQLWTGDQDRDAHLKNADFLDVENHPKITFKSKQVECTGGTSYKVTGDLTIRGTTRSVVLDADYLGQWQTPYWEGGKDKGPVTRAGFCATARINRHDFGASWQSDLENNGVVVGNEVLITIDVEAIAEPPTVASG